MFGRFSTQPKCVAGLILLFTLAAQLFLQAALAAQTNQWRIVGTEDPAIDNSSARGHYCLSVNAPATVNNTSGWLINRV